MTTGHIFFETIANLSVWCLLQCWRQGYKCGEKAHLAKATVSASSVVERSSTKVRPITAHSSFHPSPPWTTHKEKKSKNLLLDSNGSTFAGYDCLFYSKLLSHNIFEIIFDLKDFYMPEDELASPSCDRKSFVTGLRITSVEVYMVIKFINIVQYVRVMLCPVMVIIILYCDTEQHINLFIYHCGLYYVDLYLLYCYY